MNKAMWKWMLVSACLWTGSMGSVYAGDDLATIQVMMIQAQNDSAPLDRRLEKIEYRLRRVFGFQFYQYEGEGSITLGPWGEGMIELPNDHRVWIRMGNKGKAEVSWFQGKATLLSTLVTVSRDAPVVLGGVPSNGGKLILVLTRQ